jgi:hypothetical protein
VIKDITFEFIPQIKIVKSYCVSFEASKQCHMFKGANPFKTKYTVIKINYEIKTYANHIINFFNILLQNGRK